ncbi:hypothetical protein V6C42_14825 [Pseudoclostridium thermosuccinogenes]|jgi:hypothetical protein|uniref:hypothetical protein n=1 Tax=Clostridium thermosuccinogenes TaxID=84032 RepID=UPI000CCBFD5A|nr:hypothetical protein [Pseudoclostridium thermosuccinogenes]PNT92557.1 hypothetical protein CDQ83_03055 [Pseudoclostridium thermosuccinogenes]
MQIIEFSAETFRFATTVRALQKLQATAEQKELEWLILFLIITDYRQLMQGVHQLFAVCNFVIPFKSNLYSLCVKKSANMPMLGSFQRDGIQCGKGAVCALKEARLYSLRVYVCFLSLCSF